MNLLYSYKIKIKIINILISKTSLYKYFISFQNSKAFSKIAIIIM